MKNYLIYTIIGLVISGLIVIKANQKPNKIDNQSQTTQKKQISPTPAEPKKEENQINYQVFFGEQPNLCQIFPKEKIEELSGKTVINNEFKPHKELDFNQYLCKYYQEEAKYGEVSKVNIAKSIAIGVIEGGKQIKRAQEGYQMLKYTTKKDKDIPFNHLLVFDEKGKFHHLDILLSEDYKITVETWWSLLSSDEALNFVKKFALYFKDLAENKNQSNQGQTNTPASTPTSSTSSNSNQTVVPLPSDEDIIRNFVSQIEDGKADEAAKMMKINNQSPPQANSELQAWAVQFSNITSFKLLKMEKANEDEWTDTKHIYKVVLDVWMNPRSADAPIPYYGWQNGENTRWLTLEKVGNVWKIAEIATGP